MKSLATILLGVTLFMGSILYANQVDSSASHYHNSMMADGYQVTINSRKPLTDGENHISIKLSKNAKIVKNADVKISLSMPSMPGMEFTEDAIAKGDSYSSMIDFSMGGEWKYVITFTTSDGVLHKTEGSVNLQ